MNNYARLKYSINTNDILGYGSNSTVYSGNILQNTNTKTKCAIKVSEYTELNKQGVEQLENEVRILAKLSQLYPLETNPFVKFYDAFNNENELYIITEFIKGEELDVYCSRYLSGIPERIANKLFYKILQSVNELHTNNICHLDLKLENIIYNRETNSIKIIDFGFAQYTKSSHYIDKERKLKSFCGSIHYVSPEIINNIPFYGTKADVWSLGILLYALLTGNFPFNDNMDRKDVIFDLILENKVTFPSFLTTESRILISSMLNSDPLKRPTIPQIMENSWFKQ